MHDPIVSALGGKLGDPAPLDPTVRAAYEVVVAMATALHRCGTASHDIEEQMSEVTAALAIDAQFFATPTALVIQLGHGPSSETRLIRVDPATTDLRRTARVDDVLKRLLASELNVAQALEALADIERTSHPHGPVVNVFAFALASTGAARLFGGGLLELLLAFGVGACVGLLSVVAPRLRTSVTRLFEPIAALLAAVLAAVLCAVAGSTKVEVVTLAALIVLLPGLSLTQAMSELAVRNLASGTARLMGAATVLLTIAFGVAVGRGLVAPLVDAIVDLSLTSPPWMAGIATWSVLPGWTEWLAVGVTAVGLLIVLSGDPRDIPLVLCGLVFAVWGGRVGETLLGAQFGPSLAALCLGLFANVSGRIGHRPPPVVLIPGLLMLVPGSMGLRSLDLLISNAALEGVEAAFTTALTAVSLVAGLLLANAALPPAGTPLERHPPGRTWTRMSRLARRLLRLERERELASEEHSAQ